LLNREKVEQHREINDVVDANLFRGWNGEALLLWKCWCRTDIISAEMFL
jgi:hypothetical protein